MNSDLSILIATVNGSGSQSANMILAKSLFRMGAPVATKSIFPSNIAGLSTSFLIRINKKSYSSRRLKHDMVIARNPKTFLEDYRSLTPNGLFIYDSDMKLSPDAIDTRQILSISFREWMDRIEAPLPLRKVLSNMIYVGAIAEFLKIDKTAMNAVMHDQFHGKDAVIETNQRAVELGREACRHMTSQLRTIADFADFEIPSTHGSKNETIFIDGNSAAAMGAVVGGCTTMAWYPITPATSLAETFANLSKEAHAGEIKSAVIQTEDELSAICTVVGAGWAGARAMTATSGPGLSLMAEAAGLSYFAEIPTVIWDVQRAGPSTGLPTRTSQGDVLSAATLSHGDTEPIVLIPATPHECFDFAELAFDLAETLQTLVIVLSDLDLAMNFYIDKQFQLPTTEFRRGKILKADDFERGVEFARYRDVDGDGIPYRTLPGTPHPLAAYFTRGSGHTELATYSENGDEYRKLLDRLKKKVEINLRLLPAPVIISAPSDAAQVKTRHSIGLVYYGSTTQAMSEIRDTLEQRGVKSCGLQIRSLPLADEIGDFLNACTKVIVIEQNRDGQMRRLLTQKFPEQALKFSSALQYDGLPVSAEFLLPQILKGAAE